MAIVVCNASPLIAFTGINQLNILRDLWSELLIPEAVYREVVIDGEGKQGASEVQEACRVWIRTLHVKNRDEVEALSVILDEGEAECITLAQELRADLLIFDNREPRAFAKSLNIKVIGTIGIIKLAWLRGLINDPLQVINRLIIKGFWIDEGLLMHIINDIGQSLKR